METAKPGRATRRLDAFAAAPLRTFLQLKPLRGSRRTPPSKQCSIRREKFTEAAVTLYVSSLSTSIVCGIVCVRAKTPFSVTNAIVYALKV
jgi:hypothetical protein